MLKTKTSLKVVKKLFSLQQASHVKVTMIFREFSAYSLQHCQLHFFYNFKGHLAQQTRSQVFVTI